jgi:hypothetical protein
MTRNLRLSGLLGAALCLGLLSACAHQPPAPSCIPEDVKLLNLPPAGHFRREMEACLAQAETSGQDCSELLTKRTIY